MDPSRVHQASLSCIKNTEIKCSSILEKLKKKKSCNTFPLPGHPVSTEVGYYSLCFAKLWSSMWHEFAHLLLTWVPRDHRVPGLCQHHELWVQRRKHLGYRGGINPCIFSIKSTRKVPLAHSKEHPQAGEMIAHTEPCLHYRAMAAVLNL